MHRFAGLHGMCLSHPILGVFPGRIMPGTLEHWEFGGWHWCESVVGGSQCRVPGTWPWPQRYLLQGTLTWMPLPDLPEQIKQP